MTLESTTSGRLAGDVPPRPGAQAEPAPSPADYRTAAVALLAGGVATIALNAIFPRADDPSSVTAVLSTMAEHEVRQKVSFIGGTIGLWVLAAGVLGLARLHADGANGTFARLGRYAVLLGVTLFTVATGLGLAATVAAVEWVAAGSGTEGTAYAIAAAASLADDHVWAMSIIALWTGLALTGLAMVLGGCHPRWLGGWIAVAGVAGASVGVPMAYAGTSEVTMLAFAGVAVLTSLWAVVTGALMLRSQPAKG